MKLALFIFSLFVILPAQAEWKKLPVDLELEVAHLAKTLSDGYAQFYPEYAQYKEFKALHYKTTAAVLFSLGGWGGGNTNNQYFAIYGENERLELNHPHKKYSLIAFIQAGGKADRYLEDLAILKDEFHFTGKGYGFNDSLCCPTENIKVTFKLNNRGLVELPANKQINKD